MRLSIRYKIIVPFAVLLVFVGVVGTGVATAQLTNAAAAEFDAKLLHSSLQANQLLSQVDADRMADLRRATDTVGVAESLASGDTTTLARLLTPIAGNVPAASIQLRVLDVHGQELLRIRGSSEGPSPIDVTDAGAFRAQPAVISVLAGANAGERAAFLSDQPAQPVLYWVGAVRNTGDRIIGAVLLGESLTEVAAGIPGSTFYDLSGVRLATTLGAAPVASEAVRRQLTADNAVRVNETLAGHYYGTLFSTWIIHGRQFGFLALTADADSLLSLVAQQRLILTLVFTAAALLTLLVGTVTASLLTRPVELLVQAMRAVSAGDLQHRAPVVSQGEIGYLARTFNEITAS